MAELISVVLDCLYEVLVALGTSTFFGTFILTSSLILVYAFVLSWRIFHV